MLAPCRITVDLLAIGSKLFAVEFKLWNIFVVKQINLNLTDIPAVARNIIERLKRDLPASLNYHSADHAIEVVNEVMLYAKHDGLNKKNETVLIIAAAFHDAGFLFKRGQNEDLASKLAEMEMQKDGSYSNEEIEEVISCIVSTKIGKDFLRTPRSELSKYLMDADLGNLGRTDFLSHNELLIKEMEFEKNAFLRRSLVLLDKHEWLTKAAKDLREAGKRENRKKLIQLISELD